MNRITNPFSRDEHPHLTAAIMRVVNETHSGKHSGRAYINTVLDSIESAMSKSPNPHARMRARVTVPGQHSEPVSDALENTVEYFRGESPADIAYAKAEFRKFLTKQDLQHPQLRAFVKWLNSR